ncbi:MAG: threonine/serine exporter family protein, partial [Clostridia bacterium]|nr:threonine/serine exporter family protein [Clostridia bacterium]
MKDGSYSSQMRRAKSTGMNLTVLEELNALSREVCHDTPSLAAFDEKIHELKNHKGYPPVISMLAWALAAASFAVFFGGGVWECLWAALAGVAMFCIDTYSPRRMNAIAKNVMSAFLTSLIAGVSVILNGGGDGSAIIMGSLMLLVPGVSIGTAMRDIFCGDLLAGTLKLLQSCLSALMLAFGYVIAATLLGGGVI